MDDFAEAWQFDLTSAAWHSCRIPTEEELKEEDKTLESFWRRRHYDILGCFIFFAFIITACGYAYVRVRYSIAPLKDLIWYGVVVFIIEMLGALSIVFYGVWLIAVPDNSDIEALDPRHIVLRRNYHIRVLVPCYSEPLAIVKRTVLAARRAHMPQGCTLTIYLCDDGKQADKRKWVESLADSAGPEVIYITGRKRGSGKTLNGKSENLNHCLKLIYPEDRGDDEMPNVPLTELMCLFDADQSCSQQFFMALMPYIDSGDNVAVALSPQLMFNVSPNVDIFNHQNVHFWEKMQPGMDALGFISLTGTNMILRCRALQDCGWFPTESVTEDWELGMRMVCLAHVFLVRECPFKSMTRKRC
jgi:endoglucanase